MPNSITILFFISVIIGIVLVIVSLILGAKKTESIQSDNDSTTEKQNELIKVIEDADDAIEQLNSISKSIFEEQEQKYQELLYLYQIIDNKKQELLNIKIPTTAFENSSNKNIKDDSKADDIKNIKLNFPSNPIHNKIVSLYNSGKSITQIAQQLNIGQGEVDLVLELNKRGETHGWVKEICF